MAKKRPKKPTRVGTAKLLRDYYRLGKKADAKLIGKPGEIEKFAEEHGVCRDRIDKARRFVECYDEVELKELCKLGLSRTHVDYLVQVNEKARPSLQRQASKHGWSVADLKREIRQRTKKKSQGGHPHREPKNKQEALYKIIRASETWLSTCRMLLELDDPELLPGGVAKQMKNTMSSVEKSRELAETYFDVRQRVG
ncbi:MAG: hypothetical protein N2C14_04585 [Planctomycetales bacterium]